MYLMNINMTGFRLFRVFLCVCPLDGSNLSIAKVNTVDNDEDFCNANRDVLPSVIQGNQ